MQIILNNAEIQLLFQQAPETRGDGGYQNFLTKLQNKTDRITGILELTEKDLERIHRYAYEYGNGGWETRLMEIFGRVLGARLGR